LKRGLWVLLSLNCFLFQRIMVKNCKFHLKSVEIESISLSSLSLLFHISIDNPNSIDVVIDRLKYEFFINSLRVFSGTTAKGIKIPPGGSKEHSTIIDLNYKDLGEALWDAIKRGEAKYSLKGRAYVDTPFGSFSYPVEIHSP